MIQIFLIAHAPLATGFKLVAQHVLGDAIPNKAIWIDVPADEPPIQSVGRILEARQQLAIACATQDILLLTDLPHATPHNCAIEAAEALKLQGNNSYVISACTVPMVIRSLSNAHLTLEALIQKLTIS